MIRRWGAVELATLGDPATNGRQWCFFRKRV